MPYNLFFTVRRSNEFSKASVHYVGQGGETEPVWVVEDPEFTPCLEIVQECLKAIQSHMEVRREVQRRGK